MNLLKKIFGKKNEDIFKEKFENVKKMKNLTREQYDEIIYMTALPGIRQKDIDIMWNHLKTIKIIEKKEEINYEKYFWGLWSPEIHKLQEQEKFILKSDNVKIKLSNTKIEGYSGGFYVNLNSCSCKTFQKRNLPCSHIYRLAKELNLPFKQEKLIINDDYEGWIVNNIHSLINKYSENKGYSSEKGCWGAWCEEIHNMPEQRERIKNATLDSQYNTKLISCTCFDFVKRRLPCIHIYYRAKLMKRIFEIEE